MWLGIQIGHSAEGVTLTIYLSCSSTCKPHGKTRTPTLIVRPKERDGGPEPSSKADASPEPRDCEEGLEFPHRGRRDS